MGLFWSVPLNCIWPGRARPIIQSTGCREYGLLENVARSAMKISKVIIVINRSKSHSRATAQTLKAVLDGEHVAQEWVDTLPPQVHLYRRLRDLTQKKADLVIA